ncbi:hypothetical protein TCAL_10446 [Tigriopus californicus]|uniref:ISXO2-like transposase domain-containing protein n=2 Tax=Tigriopus californicus TaxID=6832 RepID=A0A553PU76_TIGCA|nr:hypothetical protein TCAL_10446 [Tigriopus californicus]
MKTEWLTFPDLVRQTAIEEETICFLVKHGLLSNESMCSSCNAPREIRHSNLVRDHYLWVCPRCYSKQSLRHGSFFTNAKLDLHQVLYFTYGWAYDLPLHFCATQSGGMTEKTATDWANFHRDICQSFVNQNHMIGGMFIDENGDLQPEEVEIDETLMARAKYHRGRHPAPIWVVGGVTRRTGNCFMVEVPNRTRQTLEEVIVEHVRGGSRIYTDGWAGYAHLNEINGGMYSHEVVIHEDNFVDPDDERINTQSIEGN